LTIVVLVVLAIVWAAVLIPPWLRNRAEGRPGDSIGAFHRQLTTLERTGPLESKVAPDARGGVGVGAGVAVRSRPRSRVQKRRRDVMLVLAGAMVATLALSLVPGLGLLLVAHLLVDVLFVAYVAVLIRLRSAAVEREMKLRFLPGAHQAVEPALALRRSAN
jgi:hypothetical protein